jgi:zinc transporter
MQTMHLRSSLSPDSDDGAARQGEAWIDIEVGDDEGRRWLASQSGLDDEIIRRLLEPAPTSYWRRFGQGLHLHLRAVAPGGDASTMPMVDLGIWLEPGRIITVRRGKVPALDRAAQDCSTGAGPSNSWELILFLLSEALNRVEQDLHDLTATIDQLEDEVLTGAGDSPIHRVAEFQKRLVYARRFRVPLANLVSFISSQPGSVIDGALRDEFEGIVNTFAQHEKLLDLSIDRASALQGQIRDQLADSLNTATFRFTWVATVFLPLSFLTGLLGINVAGIPGDHDPGAFWLVCGVLCVIAAAWGIAVGRVTNPFRRRSGPRDRSSARGR